MFGDNQDGRLREVSFRAVGKGSGARRDIDRFDSYYEQLILWDKDDLDYLWYGIGAYLQQNPQIRYLFAGLSLSNSYPKAARDLLVYFYTLYFSEENGTAIPNIPYQLPFETLAQLQQHFPGNDDSADSTQLKHLLAHMGLNIPTLYKQYSEIAEPGGVQFWPLALFLTLQIASTVWCCWI